MLQNKQDEMIYGTHKDLLSVVCEFSCGIKKMRKENERKKKQIKKPIQSIADQVW